MYCKTCGKEVDENVIACMGCGVPPQKGEKFCQHCGEGVLPEQVMCVKCGGLLADSTGSKSGSSGLGNQLMQSIENISNQKAVKMLSPRAIADYLDSKDVVLKTLNIVALLIGIGAGLALVISWAINWRWLSNIDFFPGLSLCIFQLTAPIAIYYFIRIYFIRILNGAQLKDSKYIMIPWFCLLLTTLGEAAFVGGITIALPSVFFGLALGSVSRIEWLVLLAPVYCIGAGIVVIFATRLLVESISVVFSIANDVNSIRNKQ